MIAGPSCFICDECVALSSQIVAKEVGRKPQLSPADILAKLSTRVVGHEAAKRRLAVALWRLHAQLAGSPRLPTFLIAGPTGCGKSTMADAIATAGFCGLSGIGHGLMAVAGVELTAGGRGGRAYRAGLVVLALVVLKSAYEALTGHVFFESGHVGDVGTPLVFCHAGGVIGGLLFCLGGGSGTER